MNPLVSVIMPVYNVESYILASINSILNQTYKNFELIVIDDCSNDNTWSIITKLSFLNPRIRCFRNETNMKIAASLNFGISVSRGDYILRMDGDDISSENRIERMLNFLYSNTDIDLVGCEMFLMDDLSNIIGYRSLLNCFIHLKKILKYASPVPHIWLCRRSVYDKVGEYRYSGVEDYDFLLRMVSMGMKFCNMKEALYYVRIRSGNTSSTIGYRQYVSAKAVYSLFLERIKFGFEVSHWNFQENEIEEKKYSNALAQLQLSLICLRKGNYFGSIKYYLDSIIISPRAILKLTFNRFVYNLYCSYYNFYFRKFR